MTAARMVRIAETDADQGQLDLSRVCDVLEKIAPGHAAAGELVELRERLRRLQETLNGALDASDARRSQQCTRKRHPCARLTDEDRSLIRCLRRDGMGYKRIRGKLDHFEPLLSLNTIRKACSQRTHGPPE